MANKPFSSIWLRMYGFSKLHKQHIPFRPIMSMIKYSQHKFARSLNFLLDPFFHLLLTERYKRLILRIRNIKSDITVLTSCDVKLLFFNLPLEKSIKVSIEKLYEIIKP